MNLIETTFQISAITATSVKEMRKKGDVDGLRKAKDMPGAAQVLEADLQSATSEATRRRMNAGGGRAG